MPVLANLGDPRREEVLAKAIALLEAEPPGPELVAAYGELAGVHVVFRSAYPEAIVAADRALKLAAELRLPEPARALGFRGGARASLGDREGLDDMRRTLALSIERGRSRDAGIFYTNLSEALSYYDGPVAALAVAGEGVEFAERRGIAEVTRHLGAQRLEYLAAAGRPAEALAESEPLAAQLEAAESVAWINAVLVQLHVLAERGEPERAAGDAQRLAATARDTAEVQQIATGFAAAAGMLVARGRHDEAHALLLELEQSPGVRGDVHVAAHLPELTRCALAIGDPALARRLVDGLEPFTPIHEHALCAARAQLAEAAGEHAEAAALHAEAAGRWHEFGNVPERAYALLGHGRCLRSLGRPGATVPLATARELLEQLGYKPALAETDALLAEGEAAAM